MDGFGEDQLGVSTARTGDLFSVCRRRPLWHLGRLWTAQCFVGQLARFVDYTAKLNWFLPAAMIPALAIIATALKRFSAISLFSVEKLASLLY